MSSSTICLGLLYNFHQGQTMTLSPLAVSFTTSIIRSRKLVHPTAASCVSAGPKAFVKYSKTTPFISQNWMNQMNDQFGLIFTLDNLKILYSQTLQRHCYCPLVTWVLSPVVRVSWWPAWSCPRSGRGRTSRPRTCPGTGTRWQCAAQTWSCGVIG